MTTNDQAGETAGHDGKFVLTLEEYTRPDPATDKWLAEFPPLSAETLDKLSIIMHGKPYAEHARAVTRRPRRRRTAAA